MATCYYSHDYIMIYLDRKYLLLVSSRLPLFAEKKTDVFNFRCPYCGDSQKSKVKCRAYIFQKANEYFFRCHNCQASTTFAKFLQFVDAERYKAYCVERFTEKSNQFTRKKPAVIDNTMLTGDKPSERFKKMFDIDLESIESLPKGHYARVYVENRKIPQEYFKEIFFTDKYRDFIDRNFPKFGSDQIPNDPRIVLLYTTLDRTITHVTGRALKLDHKIRYVNVKVTDDKKIFGLHRINLKKKVYVTEGQFDSFFLPNAVASGDANLIAVGEYLKKMDCHSPVLVFDNQPRSREIVKEISSAINADYSVVLLPYDSISKDINDIVKAGMTPKEVKKLVDEHTYSGLTAHVEFIKWRKT